MHSNIQNVKLRMLKKIFVAMLSILTLSIEINFFVCSSIAKVTSPRPNWPSMGTTVRYKGNVNNNKLKYVW